MRPVTLRDIARRTNLTKAAVSFALNGQPGVSDQTRRRVLAVAAELGYQPNSAARALLSGTSGAIGLVINRPGQMLGVEPFYMRLICGIESELSARGHRHSLLLAVVDGEQAEMDLYSDWWAQRRVDGVFLVDIHRKDRRGPLLERLGMPTVALANEGDTREFPAIWHDDAAAMRAVIDRLHQLGHRRVARVGGLPGLTHIRRRTASFRARTRTLGMTGVVRSADYTAEKAAVITRALLEEEDRPTAIVYDNDVMAMSGLATAHEIGLTVPEQLSIVAWDDSTLCELVRPALAALRWDVEAYGAHAAALLFSAIAGDPVSPVDGQAPRLVERASLAPPPSVG